MTHFRYYVLPAGSSASCCSAWGCFPYGWPWIPHFSPPLPYVDA